MTLNLLFLPLLGGFVFYMKWNFTRYHAARCIGQRLLFTSAGYGLLLLIAARLLVMATNEASLAQTKAIEFASLIFLGSIVSLVLALLLIASEVKEDQELRERTGTEKMLAGVLIAAVSAIAFLLMFTRVSEGRFLSTSFAVVGWAAITTVASCIAALWIRSSFKKIGEATFNGYGEGAVLFRVCLLVTIASQLAVLWAYTIDDVDRLWGKFSPYESSGTPFLACVLGLIAWWPLNLLFPHEAANAGLHRDKKTNSMERLLYSAADESSLVMLTLKDGKVYVGLVGDLPPDPASSDAYLEFLPFKSGYRDSETKQLVFTTHYEEVYASAVIAQDGNQLRDFTKVIPLANIESAGRFREDVYLEFVKTRSRNVAAPVRAGTEPR